ERRSTGKHLFEFTQLDFEIAGFDDVQARRFIEKMILAALRYIKIDMNLEIKALNPGFKIPKGPFKEYRYADLVSRYGDDWENVFVASIDSPSWIVDIPRYFYDMQDERGVWHNYDLYVPRYGEILSGGQREYRYDRLVAKMDRDGINKEKYKVLLDLAKKGELRPSAGAGLGIERFMMWITGADNIAEIQPFPRLPGERVEL
ncbi:MAG: amino acid--tRNA ligase-related protein, partial [Fervidobacterium sp.]|nr:amino acid--tRNA ligase-related protein [Fervidobacterium sp.]